MKIDTNARSSQVKDHLLGYISRNQMDQGDQLPSEAELAKTIGVSRNTVREAYITLEAEGIIVRRHGIGTFVARSPMVTDTLAGEVSGFIARISAAGYTPSFQSLSVETTIAPQEICEALHASTSENLLRVERVLLANELPAVYIIDYYTSDIKQADFSWDAFDGDMIDFATKSLGIGERQMHSRIYAILPDEEIAGHLQLSQDRPLINVRSTVTTLDNGPIGYSIAYLNPDIIEFDAVRRVRR